MDLELTNALLREYIEAAFGVVPEDGVLHLVGLRHALCQSETWITIHDPRPNQHDDSIGSFGTVLCVYAGTTDPGTTWTKDPSNPAGAAHLVPGAWDYQLGLHKGNPALVQAGEVCVRRDEDRDAKPESDEPLDCGWFGINIHSGAADDSMPVDSWSAGCQVIPANDWPSFYWTGENSGQTYFKYFLIDAKLLGQWLRGE
jgi:hypothetical protein